MEPSDAPGRLERLPLARFTFWGSATSFESDLPMLFNLHCVAFRLLYASWVERTGGGVCCRADKDSALSLQGALLHPVGDVTTANLKEYPDQVVVGQTPGGQSVSGDGNDETMLGGRLRLLRCTNKVVVNNRKGDQERPGVITPVRDLTRSAKTYFLLLHGGFERR